MGRPPSEAGLYDSHCIGVDLSNFYEHHSSSLPLLCLVLMMAVTSLPAILQRRSAVLLRSRHRAVAPGSSSIIESLDVCAPLIHVGSQHASIVSQ